MATTQFRIEPNAFLGHLFSQHRDVLYSFSISNPSDYFKARAAIVKDVKYNAVKDLYNTLYSVMTEGKIGDQEVNKDGVNLTFVPGVPPTTVNEIALGAAKTLDRILDDVIDLIIPISYHDLASKRLEMKGLSNGIN